MVCVKAQDQHRVGINTRLPVPLLRGVRGVDIEETDLLLGSFQPL